MDRRVLIIRRRLLLIAAFIVCLFEPGLWFCLFATPIIWTRTKDGSTGILIHPDGPPWKIAVGDSTDGTCACCGADCQRCETGTAPLSYQAVVTGVVDGTCADCEFWNGTFELDEYGTLLDGQNYCFWKYTDSAPCSLFPWIFTIYRIGGGASDPPDPLVARRAYVMTYDNTAFPLSTAYHFFQKSLAAGTDKSTCDLTDENLPPNTGFDPTPPCDLTSASCLITAL